MRHHIGRMRRLVLAFSKDPEHHKTAVALCYVHYNLVLTIRTTRLTPAMGIGVQRHPWELPELLDALLSVPETAAPLPKPLAHRVPDVTSRALPNGRGFLRVLQGGNAPVPSTGPATPPPVAVAAAPSAELPTGQLDLLSWKPKPPPAPKRLEPGQLSLFGIDFDPNFTK